MKVQRGLIVIVVLMFVAGWFGASPAQAIVDPVDCATQSEIPQLECEALVALYTSTAGASWTDNTNWLDYSNVCGWYGVTCSGSHVSQLIESPNNLIGSIPSELGNLSQLWRLELGWNQLSGGIPTTLGNLSQLTILSLASNQLTGSIPSELGNLSNLQYFYMHNNLVNGSIPTTLGNLSQLKELYLTTNQLTGGVPTSLGNLSQLEKLSLADNQLTGGIPLSFTSLSLLHTFYFYTTSLCEPPDASYQTWKAGVTTYTGTHVICPVEQDMFYSQSAYDGWVLETGENTNAGGLLNTDNLICNIGDDAQNRQYRTILHFNTSRIPDNAVITKVTLQYKQLSIVGSDPYATHGNVWADIKEGFFSNNPGLVVSDFAAGPSQGFAGSFSFYPSSLAFPIYRAELKESALQYLNLEGITQFRLRFGLDDDNDNIADYLKIFCGDMPVPFNRPVLRVWYYVP